MVTCLAAIAVLQASGPARGPLVWSDEFSGTKLNPLKWDAPAMPRQGNSCTWDPKMVEVGDGVLKLKVEKLGDTGPRYACGAVRTQPDYDPSRAFLLKKYGVFEIRARLPRNLRGDYWFAFWFMAGNISDGQTDTRKGSEIDVFESFHAYENKLSHNVHWGGYGATHNSFGFPSNPIPELQDGKMHTYTLVWSEKEYVVYFDGREIARTNAIGLGNKEGRPKSQGTSQQPGYLKLSLEACDWVGPSSDWEKVMPQSDEVLVDWVRVYDLKS